ncbi:MAG: hypothetical protein SWH61_12340 [Thermodesulfobacteriota bacterium]|nr:hypothetical protein [Thermodesulfobacteriota bacterium]
MTESRLRHRLFRVGTLIKYLEKLNACFLNPVQACFDGMNPPFP